MILIITACKGQEFETELTIYNNSFKTLDSIVLHDVFDKEITYRNIKPGSIIKVEYNERYSKIPPGERGVFSINVFEENYFYGQTVGFIGFPGTTINEKYELYIYSDYIATKKDFKPKYPAEKRKISEYLSGHQ